MYLTDINEDTNRCKLGYYLTEDLIESIDKSDGYPIIDSQDYEKIDLNTLKVSKTNIENVFKVSFINYKERVLNVKLVPVGNSFKIVSITIFRKNINFTYPSTVTKPGTIDAYDFDLLSYVTDSAGDRTQVSFFLEDFSNGFVFTKGSYDENFEYRCIKKKQEKT
ncbi:hypothetical protein Celal_1672 [Cellulophaga algicola DSM 14237]|uniref:Uncharacterized protein n=1 Tax=Cellulophaga algicola (strain DSM 14237 / IC166 / ACAM 630) TaxID=688270 RepID=E6XBX7_CELAD|nr:hypothetical protein [Cellulophaga algicola]ADV48979.1 hypothetical protein Celal_1672 [Cellulophaga algicola DSM 14237]